MKKPAQKIKYCSQPNTVMPRYLTDCRHSYLSACPQPSGKPNTVSATRAPGFRGDKETEICLQLLQQDVSFKWCWISCSHRNFTHCALATVVNGKVHAQIRCSNQTPGCQCLSCKRGDLTKQVSPCVHVVTGSQIGSKPSPCKRSFSFTRSSELPTRVVALYINMRNILFTRNWVSMSTKWLSRNEAAETATQCDAAPHKRELWLSINSNIIMVFKVKLNGCF